MNHPTPEAFNFSGSYLRQRAYKRLHDAHADALGLLEDAARALTGELTLSELQRRYFVESIEAALANSGYTGPQNRNAPQKGST